MAENASDQVGPVIYCIKCRYVLNGLPLHRCPECGTEYDPGDESTFWMPGRQNWWSIRWEVFASLACATACVLTMMLLVRSKRLPFDRFGSLLLCLDVATVVFAFGFAISAGRRGTTLSRRVGTLLWITYLGALLCLMIT